MEIQRAIKGESSKDENPKANHQVVQQDTSSESSADDADPNEVTDQQEGEPLSSENSTDQRNRGPEEAQRCEGDACNSEMAVVGQRSGQNSSGCSVPLACAGVTGNFASYSSFRIQGNGNSNGPSVVEQFFIDHGYGSLSVRGGFIVVGAFDLIITSEGISTYLGVGLGAGLSATATIGAYAGPDSSDFNIKTTASGGFGVGANGSVKVSEQGVTPSAGIGTGFGGVHVDYPWL